MKRFLHWLGFHDWTQWGESYLGKDAYWQLRRCKICNKEQADTTY